MKTKIQLLYYPQPDSPEQASDPESDEDDEPEQRSAYHKLLSTLCPSANKDESEDEESEDDEEEDDEQLSEGKLFKCFPDSTAC